MAVIPCPDGACLHHFEPGGHCTCRPDNRIYRTAPAGSTCECGSPAVGTVDTGRDTVPVCLVHAQIESAAGVEVTLLTDPPLERRPARRGAVVKGAPLPSVPNWARRAEAAEARLAAIDALLKEAIAAYNALPAKVEAPATEVQS